MDAIHDAMTIRLDDELPDRPAFVPGCRRAPRREAKLTEADKALLLSMARQLNEARKKRDGQAD